MSDKEIVKGELEAKFNKYLTRITPFGFSDTLLVDEANEIILNKGYGIAIREKSIRNTAITVWHRFTHKAVHNCCYFKLEKQD